MDKTRQQMNYITYKDVYIVEDDDEAQEFRYEHNDEPVEIGTPVAYDVYTRGSVFNGHPSKPARDTCVLTCFAGIYNVSPSPLDC